MRRRVAVWVACVAALAIACSHKAEQAEKKPMTKAQQDSAMAESRLPGAGVLKKSLEVSDSARVRADRENEDYQ